MHVRLLNTGAYLQHDLLRNTAAVQQFATIKLADKFQREPTVTMTPNFKDRSLKVRHKCSMTRSAFILRHIFGEIQSKIKVKVT